MITSAYHQVMSHELISQTKAFANNYTWWPGMDAAVNVRCGMCCRPVSEESTVALLHPWPWPTRIWQRNHIDFAEKDIMDYLIVADRHSKWLELCQ